LSFGLTQFLPFDLSFCILIFDFCPGFPLPWYFRPQPERVPVNVIDFRGNEAMRVVCLADFAYDKQRRTSKMKFERITVNAEQMGGVACIRGLRIPVATIVGMVAEGMSEAEILRAYPDLKKEDIREALRYAAEAVKERELPVVAP
jgi:uncharacterized protein (DUF433 family)